MLIWDAVESYLYARDAKQDRDEMAWREAHQVSQKAIADAKAARG